MKIKKLFLFFLVLVVLLALTRIVLAQGDQNEEIKYPGRPVETDYPKIDDERPESTITSVPKYVKYVYNFFIWASALLALIVLVMGGFKYFISAGSIDKIRDAKSQITAAILGLLILFASYLILTSINPDLVVFRLKRIKPIISALPSGVLVCQKEVEVSRAFQLTNNFKKAEEYWQQKEIAEELSQIIEIISDNCYAVNGQGDIRSDLDNKITNIYFIPGEEFRNKESYLALYGAVVYEKRGYGGKSQSLHKHISLGPGGALLPVEYNYDNESDGKIKIAEISSIKPFRINMEPSPTWSVVLYKDSDYIGVFGEEYFFLHRDPCGENRFWCDIDLSKYFSWSPESIKIEGDYLIVLFAENDRSETFSESDRNLLDNENIVKRECYSSGFGFTGSCKNIPNAKRLLILSAGIY